MRHPTREPPDLREVFRDDEEMTIASPQLVWSCQDAAPGLFDAVLAKEPGLDVILERMKTSLPVARFWKFGASGAFVRPLRHSRAIYLQLAAIRDGATGCVAIKGSECVAENYDQFLERLSELWSFCGVSISSPVQTLILDAARLSALERFPLMEGKPPGVHPLSDALEEAACAAEFQSRHIEHYGEVARVPVPLMVFRWDEAVSRRVLGCIAARLPPKVLRIIEHEVAEGLGTYVYYYPSLPIRVAHLPIPDTSGGLSLERMTALCGIDSPRVAVDGWLELTARLLAMGYVATDPRNLGRGYCIQPQNLVIDGGFVDLNSLRRMDSIASEPALRFAIMRTLQVLTRSLGRFLIGRDVGGNHHFDDGCPEAFALVREAVFARLRADASRGVSLHPVLRDLLRTEETFDQLWQAFSALFDPGGRSVPSVSPLPKS